MSRRRHADSARLGQLGWPEPAINAMTSEYSSRIDKKTKKTSKLQAPSRLKTTGNLLEIA
jgi:hypothetical protein